MVRISAGSCQDLKNWNLLQSGQALGIMTVAGKFSNADAIFVGVRRSCLLPSHRNNIVEDQVCAVEKWAISSRKTQKSNLLKPKECKYQNTTQVGARFLHLDWQGGGRFAPLPPVSYATDQVQFKHEQPKVLLIKSHITIGTIQQTQYAASVL